LSNLQVLRKKTLLGRLRTPSKPFFLSAFTSLDVDFELCRCVPCDLLYPFIVGGVNDCRLAHQRRSFLEGLEDRDGGRRTFNLPNSILLLFSLWLLLLFFWAQHDTVWDSSRHYLLLQRRFPLQTANPSKIPQFFSTFPIPAPIRMLESGVAGSRWPPSAAPTTTPWVQAEWRKRRTRPKMVLTREQQQVRLLPRDPSFSSHIIFIVSPVSIWRAQELVVKMIAKNALLLQPRCWQREGEVGVRYCSGRNDFY
jgi:hypothetical protein